MFTKKILSMILFLFLVILLIMTGCSKFQQGLVPALEDDTTAGALSFIPADAAGGITKLSLQASSVNELKGYSVILSYDPSLQIAEVIEGDFLSSEGTTFFYPDINQQAGTLQIDCALLGKGLSVSGTGTLAILNFTSQKSGTDTLTFSQMKVRDVSNQEMDLAK